MSKSLRSTFDDLAHRLAPGELYALRHDHSDEKIRNILLQRDWRAMRTENRRKVDPRIAGLPAARPSGITAAAFDNSHALPVPPPFVRPARLAVKRKLPSGNARPDSTPLRATVAAKRRPAKVARPAFVPLAPPIAPLPHKVRPGKPAIVWPLPSPYNFRLVFSSHIQNIQNSI